MSWRVAAGVVGIVVVSSCCYSCCCCCCCCCNTGKFSNSFPRILPPRDHRFVRVGVEIVQIAVGSVLVPRRQFRNSRFVVIEGSWCQSQLRHSGRVLVTADLVLRFWTSPFVGIMSHVHLGPYFFLLNHSVLMDIDIGFRDGHVTKHRDGSIF